jgi:L-alanine-DL-glutamate epimerase-like enolase superfamily enzyme
MKVKYKVVSLPFKHTFAISKASKTHQSIFLIELDHFGIKGYGEAPAISYYNISI